MVPYRQGAVAGIRLWEEAEVGQRLPPEERLGDAAKAIPEILDLSAFLTAARRATPFLSGSWPGSRASKASRRAQATCCLGPPPPEWPWEKDTPKTGRFLEFFKGFLGIRQALSLFFRKISVQMQHKEGSSSQVSSQS